jgi:hypothetical protein
LPRLPPPTQLIANMTPAPLNDAAASFASKYTNLQNQWGTTEAFKAIDLETSPQDYAYCAFDMLNSGIKMEPIPLSAAPPTTTTTTTAAALTPLVKMHLTKTAASALYSPYFARCPNETTHDTSDLWTPHPDPRLAPFTFRYAGRADDMICWADGTNLMPTAWELSHADHPLVRCAVMFGTQRRQPVLLLELEDQHISDTGVPGGSDGIIGPASAAAPSSKAADKDKADTALLEKLFLESVSVVNGRAPQNAQVAMTHVLLVGQGRCGGKVFARNIKGTVARKATLLRFEPEIKDLYDRFGDRDYVLSTRLV